MSPDARKDTLVMQIYCDQVSIHPKSYILRKGSLFLTLIPLVVGFFFFFFFFGGSVSSLIDIAYFEFLL